MESRPRDEEKKRGREKERRVEEIETERILRGVNNLHLVFALPEKGFHFVPRSERWRWGEGGKGMDKREISLK